MLRRPLGSTGLDVSALGYGAMQIGAPEIDEDRAASMLNYVLDCGINLIDTARAYGLAEERIGRHVAGRRSEYLLSTKVGYGVDGVADWTPEAIERGVDDACVRMRTDRIDIVHLHSCDRRTLECAGVLEALVRSREAGKVRFIAYSGENDALAYAIGTRVLDVIQLSVNVCDQRSLHVLGDVRASGLGVLAKRPFAERAWRHGERPADPATAEYRQRFHTMFPGDGDDAAWTERALRFAAFASGVDCCLVGTTQPRHLADDIEFVSRGLLPPAEIARLRAAFGPHGGRWPGLI